MLLKSADRGEVGGVLDVLAWLGKRTAASVIRIRYAIFLMVPPNLNIARQELCSKMVVSIPGIKEQHRDTHYCSLGLRQTR